MNQHTVPVVTQVTRYDVKLTVLYIRSLVRAHVTVFWRESDGEHESTHTRTCLKQFNNRGEFLQWVNVQETAGFVVKVTTKETSK